MSSDETIEIAKAELMKAYDAAVDASDGQAEQPKVKHCKHCDQTKPAKEFGARIGAKDGLQFYCRKCNREISRDWRLRNEKTKREIIAKTIAKAEASGKLKRCKTCKEAKPFNEFRTRKSHGDGKYSHCRECERLWDRTRSNTRGWRKIATQVNAMGAL